MKMLKLRGVSPLGGWLLEAELPVVDLLPKPSKGLKLTVPRYGGLLLVVLSLTLL